MSTLDDSAEVPGAANMAADDLSAGDPSATARPSASATPVRESVYEGADKIVPSTAPTVVKIEGHTENVDPLARGNRLRKESWGLVLRLSLIHISEPTRCSACSVIELGT